MFSWSLNWDVLFVCLTDAVRYLWLFPLTTLCKTSNLPFLTSHRVNVFAGACRSWRSWRGWTWGVTSSLKWWGSICPSVFVGLGLFLFLNLIRVTSYPSPISTFSVFFSFQLCNKSSCFFATILTIHSSVFQTAQMKESRSPPVCRDARLPRLSPPCLTSFLLSASTAWGVGATERNQGAVDGWQQTDVPARGIFYLVPHTLRQKQSSSPCDVPTDGQFIC